MPRGDRTGPLGMGPMTGRRAGYCAGLSVPGYMNQYGSPGFYRRMRRGGGQGFGRGIWYTAPMPPYVNPAFHLADYAQSEYVRSDGNVAPAEQEIEMLKTQAAHLETTLNNLRKQIENLENDASGEER